MSKEVSIEERIAALEAQIKGEDPMAKGKQPDEFTVALDAMGVIAQGNLGDAPATVTADVDAITKATPPAGAPAADDDNADEKLKQAFDAFPIVKSLFAAVAQQGAELAALRTELHASRKSDETFAKATIAQMEAIKDIKDVIESLGDQPEGRKAQLNIMTKGQTPTGAEADPEKPEDTSLKGPALMIKARGLVGKEAGITASDISVLEHYANAGLSLQQVGQVDSDLAMKVSTAIAAAA